MTDTTTDTTDGQQRLVVTISDDVDERDTAYKGEHGLTAVELLLTDALFPNDDAVDMAVETVEWEVGLQDGEAPPSPADATSTATDEHADTDDESDRDAAQSVDVGEMPVTPSALLALSEAFRARADAADEQADDYAADDEWGSHRSAAYHALQLREKARMASQIADFMEKATTDEMDTDE